MLRPEPVRFAGRLAGGLVLLALPLVLAGCGGGGGRLPPVFGAVFGLEGAETYPFVPGRVAEPAVGPGDRLIGESASQPGQCIYADDGTARRFRAACPDGFNL